MASITYRLIPKGVAANDECETSTVKIAVEIKGLVKNPGVYYFSEDKRIVDLINASGGLLPDASIECINQTTLLKDKMTVIIASQKEVTELYQPPEETVVIAPPEKEEKVIEVCTCEYVTITVDDETEVEEEDLISLNNGSIDQLSSLPGIGESKARAIIEYREKTPFTDISEIVNVKGIGNATFENIKHLIKE